jgi:hypothetical protein
MYMMKPERPYAKWLQDYDWHNDVGWEHLPRFIKNNPDIIKKLENGDPIDSEYVTYRLINHRLFRKLKDRIPIRKYINTRREPSLVWSYIVLLLCILGMSGFIYSFNNKEIGGWLLPVSIILLIGPCPMGLAIMNSNVRKFTIWLLLLGCIALSLFNVYPLSVPKNMILSAFTSPQQRPATVTTATKVGTNTPIDNTRNVATPAKPDSEANLVNPSWAQLRSFLLADKTDEIPYVYPTFICDDFARTLQANAKRMGWRCAIVRLKMTGYTDPYGLGIASDAGHTCNAFQTTDRGLVYIDCTGVPGNAGPPNKDKIVNIQIGGRYIPESIFYVGNWRWNDMGLIVGIESIEW